MKENTEEVKLNDGKGLWDNAGLIDSMVLDLNSIMKHLISGQYIAFCDQLRLMAQKLVNLKTGMKNELADRDAQRAELRKLNDELAAQVYGVPVDPGTANKTDSEG